MLSVDMSFQVQNSETLSCCFVMLYHRCLFHMAPIRSSIQNVLEGNKSTQILSSFHLLHTMYTLNYVGPIEYSLIAEYFDLVNVA